MRPPMLLANQTRRARFCVRPVKPLDLSKYGVDAYTLWLSIRARRPAIAVFCDQRATACRHDLVDGSQSWIHS